MCTRSIRIQVPGTDVVRRTRPYNRARTRILDAAIAIQTAPGGGEENNRIFCKSKYGCRGLHAPHSKTVSTVGVAHVRITGIQDKAVGVLAIVRSRRPSIALATRITQAAVGVVTDTGGGEEKKVTAGMLIKIKAVKNRYFYKPG